jgi:hypothetical protein
VHLVGIIIRIYHDPRSRERPILVRLATCVLLYRLLVDETFIDGCNSLCNSARCALNLNFTLT